MEIVKNESKISSVEIMRYMEDFCNSRGWNIEEISHTQYKAVCMAVGLNFFNDKTAILYINNNKNHGFNYDQLLSAYNVYNSLCMLYNKIPSIITYCYFINTDTQLLYNAVYDNDNYKSSRACGYLLQKLNEIREDALKDRAIDRGGAVGVAIVGNQEYSWNDPKYRPAIQGAGSLEALPAFTSNQKAIE